MALGRGGASAKAESACLVKTFVEYRKYAPTSMQQATLKALSSGQASLRSLLGLGSLCRSKVDIDLHLIPCPTIFYTRG